MKMYQKMRFVLKKKKTKVGPLTEGGTPPLLIGHFTMKIFKTPHKAVQEISRGSRTSRTRCSVTSLCDLHN